MPDKIARVLRDLPEILFQYCTSPARTSVSTDGTAEAAVATGVPGLNLIRILSEQNVPVIALTGRGDSESRIQGLNAGALQYFVKPTDLNELVAITSPLLRPFRRFRPADRCR